MCVLKMLDWIPRAAFTKVQIKIKYMKSTIFTLTINNFQKHPKLTVMKVIIVSISLTGF